MTTGSAQARGDLAEAMLPVAVNLACLVHGDGGPEDIHAELGALDSAEKDALIVVLAGLVDPDRPIGRALGWLDFDEAGQPVVPEWGDQAPLRHLAEDDAGDAAVGEEPDTEDAVDEVAVMAYLEGRRVAVTPRERAEAIARGVKQRGMTYLDFDRAHGLRYGYTAVWISRERAAAAERGEPFPDTTAPGKRPPVTEAEVVAIREAAAGGAEFLALALSNGLDRETISRIVHGETYRQYGGPVRGDGKRRSPGGFQLKGALSTHGLASVG